MKHPNSSRWRFSLGRSALIVALWGAATLFAGSTALPAQTLADAAEARYVAIWEDMEAVGEAVAAALRERPDLDSVDEVGFELLERELSRRKDSAHTLLVIDGAGSTEAWAGAGLLHPVEERPLPARGRSFRMSFSAVTLLSVSPLGEGPRPPRLVVGRSFDRRTFPWLDGSKHAPTAWGVERHDAGAGSEPRWVLSVAVPETPTLLLADPEALEGAPVATGAGRPGWVRVLAWIAAVLALATVASRQGRRTERSTMGPGDRRGRAAFSLAIGAAAFGVGASWIGALSLALAALLALSAMVAPIRFARRGLATIATAAAGTLAAVTLGLYFPTATRESLATHFLQLPGEDLAFRAGLGVGFAAIFAALGTRERGGAYDLWLPLGFGSFLVSGALATEPVFALPIFALGALFCSAWLVGHPARLSFRWIFVWCLVSALASSVAWQGVSLRASENRWVREALPRLTEAPTEALERIVTTTRESFAGADISELFFADPAGVRREDLAYALWRRSDLAVEGTLSALVVTAGDKLVSSFTFGLPVDVDGNLDRSSERWQAVSDLVWEDALDGSEAELHLYGHPWARVRFWVAVLPSFRGPEQRLDDLASGLLRGGPTANTVGAAPVPGADFVLYGEDGSILDSPWASSPVLDADELEGERAPTEWRTPEGRSRLYAWREPRGLAAMFVPRLRPGMAIERVGVQAVGTLLSLLVIAAVWLALAVRRQGVVEGFGLVMRSYPRRLLVVYTLLLLVPLLLLNIVLLRTVSQRLELEARSAGIAAMEAAQSILGSYVVSLDPGFVLETAVDDNLLLWLSQVVDHELNLYWGSRLSASSKRELFTAGFLPERIPGGVYSQLSTGQVPLASRTRSAGDEDYLEFYAPLRLPGVDRLGANLFLSMPLLAQEEEVATEIAALRRKVLLASAGLFLLLLGVGGRLARNFTAPIMALVRGTERIAAGEGRLRIEPRDTELLTLSRAIDDMAERIARARGQLQREKEVVESMVENITAGVVSLDPEGRVLMTNRVAKELLEIRIGSTLAESWRGRSDFRAILDFAEEDPTRLRRATLRLARGEETVDSGSGSDVEESNREWSTVWVPLAPEGELGALLVVEDVTEVLRGQRLEAWAEMARMIAHEIKNPLTPIRLSTEHLREVYASEPERIGEIFERCTTNILGQVEALRAISSEFATYSRIPKIDLQEGDLRRAAAEVVEGYAASGAAGGVPVELESGLDSLAVRFDPKLIARALRNLVENAVRASPDGAAVTVSVEREGERALLRVRDRGPGVDAGDLDRIFEPYFSTHETGTGLGLPITRRIAEEHGGSIAARNLADGGLEVRISLPLDPSPPSH